MAPDMAEVVEQLRIIKLGLGFLLGLAIGRFLLAEIRSCFRKRER